MTNIVTNIVMEGGNLSDVVYQLKQINGSLVVFILLFFLRLLFCTCIWLDIEK